MENSHATMIDPLTQKFWGLALNQAFNQTSTSEEHRADMNSKHSHPMGRKDPCLGSVVMSS
jgi:hypothetical protein